MATLQIVKENGDVERLSLVGGEITIGRVENNDLVLNDFSVSRKHARLYQKDDTWILEDLGSHNGTLVNKKIIQRTELVDGDHIKVGNNHLVFQTDEIAEHDEQTLELPETGKPESTPQEPEQPASPPPEPERVKPIPPEPDKIESVEPEPDEPSPVEPEPTSPTPKPIIPEPEPPSSAPSPPQPVEPAPPAPTLPSAHETVQITLHES
ncbi:MAG: FHA domain-containing protein, partial [Candidatus Aminicenantes bacterium]|nr:FHA domain-containing protein [Candidatus Aminicenantes bacterium]